LTEQAFPRSDAQRTALKISATLLGNALIPDAGERESDPFNPPFSDCKTTSIGISENFFLLNIKKAGIPRPLLHFLKRLL